MATVISIGSVPGWAGIPKNYIETKRITGGLTNILTKVFISPSYVSQLPPGTITKVLVRHFGRDTEKFVNKDKEGIIFEKLSSSGVGPKLITTFQGGRIEQFLEAETLKTYESKLYIPEISEVMAGIHHLEIPELPHEPSLISTLTSWWEFASKVSFPEKNPKYNLLKQIDFDALYEEIEEIESYISQIDSPIVFCHNDIVSGNLMRSSTGEFHIIDFEYGGYNYRGYDIANHFCEWIVNYSVESYPQFKISSDNYPTAEQKELFATSYLKKYFKLKGIHKENIGPEIKRFIEEIDQFMMIPHLLWALWAVMQSASSTITFGYLDFALQRIEQYYLVKHKINSKYHLFKCSKHRSTKFLLERQETYSSQLNALYSEHQVVKGEIGKAGLEKSALLAELNILQIEISKLDKQLEER